MRRLRSALAVTALALTTLVAPLPGEQPAQAAGGPITIMPLGDSITRGHGSSTGDGYRWNLGDRLVLIGGVNAYYVGSQRSGQGPNKNNEGWPGATMAQLTAGIPTWMATVPDITLLYTGIPDAHYGRTAPQMLADMSVLLDTILARSATNKVMVAKVAVNLYSSGRWGSATLQQFNAELPALVATKGPRVAIADMSIIPPSSLPDGTHPNDLGYSQMGWIWYVSLAKWLSPTGYLPWSEVPFPSVPKLD